jgi:hypothetical protein
VHADPFQVASDALAGVGGQVSELARPFLHFLPVSGASVSTFGPLLGAETISATDALAGRVDELQFDLGEGPCWDALGTRRPVLEPDLSDSSQTSWPAFMDAIRTENIGAVFAFPLVFGPLDIGAVDLYSVNPVTLTREQQRQTLALSAIVSRILLRHALKGTDGYSEPTMFSRRLIHQATGMVLAQLDVSADDAHLLIQARAFAEGRTMQQVATDVVERRIRFTDASPDGTTGCPAEGGPSL